MSAEPRPDDVPLLSPEGARPLAVAAWVCGAAAPLLLGYGVLLGILGMALGSGAHLKGDRWGMPAAVLSGVTCVLAMVVVLFVR